MTMDGNGWIKLHRQLKDHWLWKSEKRLKWWIDVLLTVNHSETKVMVNGHLIECQKGQSIRSLNTWAKDWNVSKKAVRDYFKLLERDSIISLESVHFTTRITVCKYEDYQGQVNAKYTEGKREGNPNKNDKNDKNNIPVIFEVFRKAFQGNKRGLQTELDNFLKKNRPETVHLLLPALEKEKQHRETLSGQKKFVPEWKNLSTWINQKCWEQEFTETGNDKTSTKPKIPQKW